MRITDSSLRILSAGVWIALVAACGPALAANRSKPVPNATVPVTEKTGRGNLVREQLSLDQNWKFHLGDIPVTVDVGALSPDKICRALENGARRAAALKEQGLIVAAYLQLQGQMLVVGPAGRIAAGEAA